MGASPSSLCYNKKRKGDSSVVVVTFCAVTKNKKRRQRRQHCHHLLRCKKKKGDCYRLLHYVTTKEKEKGNDNVATVAFCATTKEKKSL
jgi:hypothetical protein